MAQPPRSLNGKVVAITGAARGIGKATAVALGREGARVAIADLDGELAAQAAQEVGGDTISAALDVADSAAFTRFLDEVEERLGPLDVLVDNAGIMPLGPIEDEDERTTERHVAINFTAVIHGTREAVQRMKPRQTGHIVNIASVAAKAPVPQGATYCGTKFAVLGFSDAVAQELHGTGVEISAVMPTYTRTALVSGMKEVRGIPAVGPEAIAAAIVETLKRPRFEVPVPLKLSPLLKLMQALPFRLRTGLSRATGLAAAAGDIDPSGRAAYDRRMAETIGGEADREEALSR